MAIKICIMDGNKYICSVITTTKGRRKPAGKRAFLLSASSLQLYSGCLTPCGALMRPQLPFVEVITAGSGQPFFCPVMPN